MFRNWKFRILEVGYVRLGKFVNVLLMCRVNTIIDNRSSKKQTEHQCNKVKACFYGYLHLFITNQKMCRIS